MSFPQLLRRSQFAAHDPLISRVYTSTQSAIAKHGDWGLKYPIHRARGRGPRFIRFSNLDAGRAVGADWRSAEPEARLVGTWGDGRTAWTRARAVGAGAPVQPRGLYDYSSAGAGAGAAEQRTRTVASGPVPLADVAGMSEVEFERYLERIRRERAGELAQRVEPERQGLEAAGWRDGEGDFTLINLAMRGKTSDDAGKDIMVRNMSDRLVAPQSKVLISRPHHLGGMVYSSAVGGTGTSGPARVPTRAVDPEMTLSGRGLDRETDRQQRFTRAMGNVGHGTARAMSVSVGGLSARYTPDNARIMATEGPVVEATDFTQTHPAQGLGRFRTLTAVLGADPTVLGLGRGREDTFAVPFDNERQRPPSRAALPRPLDTFRHTVSLELTSSPGVSQTYIEPGSAGYVARETPRSQRMLRSDAHGIQVPGAGGPRSMRSGTAALSELRRRERAASAANAQGTASMLSRLAGQGRGQGAGGAAAGGSGRSLEDQRNARRQQRREELSRQAGSGRA